MLLKHFVCDFLFLNDFEVVHKYIFEWMYAVNNMYLIEDFL